MTDLDKLEALAKAALKAKGDNARWEALDALESAANPAAILDLIASARRDAEEIARALDLLNTSRGAVGEWPLRPSAVPHLRSSDHHQAKDVHRAEALGSLQSTARAKQRLSPGAAAESPRGWPGEAIRLARCQKGSVQTRLPEASRQHPKSARRRLLGVRHSGSPRLAGAPSSWRRTERAGSDGLAVSQLRLPAVGHRSAFAVQTAVRQLPSDRASS